MFGKIKGFKVNENIVKVEFENIEAKINIISPNIINFLYLTLEMNKVQWQ